MSERYAIANKLQDQGFGVERKRDDFEIGGIPADVLKRFSRRTALIEKLAQEKGITNPDRKAELRAETREKKVKALSWEALRREWNTRLSNQDRKVLAAVSCDWSRRDYKYWFSHAQALACASRIELFACLPIFG